MPIADNKPLRVLLVTNVPVKNIAKKTNPKKGQ